MALLIGCFSFRIRIKTLYGSCGDNANHACSRRDHSQIRKNSFSSRRFNHYITYICSTVVVLPPLMQTSETRMDRTVVTKSVHASIMIQINSLYIFQTNSIVYKSISVGIDRDWNRWRCSGNLQRRCGDLQPGFNDITLLLEVLTGS